MTSNDILFIYQSLTQNELIEALKDIELAGQTGSFSDDSFIRKLCRKVSEITGLDISSNLMMVQMGVYQEASRRYLTLINGL